MRCPVIASSVAGLLAAASWRQPAAACHDDLDPTNDTYTQWSGDRVVDLQLSAAGDSVVAVVRIIGRDDQLVAIAADRPDTAIALPVSASGFRVAGSADAHLLVTQDPAGGVNGAILGLVLRRDGQVLGDSLTIFGEGTGDQRPRAVVFDGRDFVVVVDTGPVYDDELWLVRVSPSGALRDPGPVPLDVAEDAMVLPGPQAGTLWIVEERSDESPGRVVAHQLSADGSTGPEVDLGSGRLNGGASAPGGGVLILRDPDETPSASGTVATIVTAAGSVGDDVALGTAGFWQASARPGGGFLLAADSEGTISWLALAGDGAPTGSPTRLAEGSNARLVGNHLAWSDWIEDGDMARSHANLVAFDASGRPAQPISLVEREQESEQVPCSHACSASGRGAGSGAATFAAVALIALALHRRRRPGHSPRSVAA